MIAHLKTIDKAAFDTALTDALNALGAIEYPEGFELPESLRDSIILKAVNTDEEGNEKVTKIVLDYTRSHPKARDEQGEFIATETDEDGNPTAYQMAEGYHVELACNVNLDLSAIEVTPAQPQFGY